MRHLGGAGHQGVYLHETRDSLCTKPEGRGDRGRGGLAAWPWCRAEADCSVRTLTVAAWPWCRAEADSGREAPGHPGPHIPKPRCRTRRTRYRGLRLGGSRSSGCRYCQWAFQGCANSTKRRSASRAAAAPPLSAAASTHVPGGGGKWCGRRLAGRDSEPGCGPRLSGLSPTPLPVTQGVSVPRRQRQRPHNPLRATGRVRGRRRRRRRRRRD